ncbi:MAG: response regulator [Patescibacteria group bacterium]
MAEKILLVDDDKFLIDMYSLKFSELGYSIESAMSGAEALEKVSGSLQPDICLIDIIMPGMDGFQLIQELANKGVTGRATVIVLSNLGQKDDIERALTLGVDGYIVKASSTPSEVVAKVKEIAGQKQLKLGRAVPPAFKS